MFAHFIIELLLKIFVFGEDSSGDKGATDQRLIFGLTKN